MEDLCHNPPLKSQRSSKKGCTDRKNQKDNYKETAFFKIKVVSCTCELTETVSIAVQAQTRSNPIMKRWSEKESYA